MKKQLLILLAALLVNTAATAQGNATKTDLWIYNTNPNSSLPNNRSNIPNKSTVYDTTNGNWYTKKSNSVYALHPGGGGGGTIDTVIVYRASADSSSPEAWGAVHQNLTFAGAGYNQSYINTFYPGVGAVTTDQIDWAACQASYNWSKDNGWWHGQGMYYVNKGILFSDSKKTNAINFAFTAVNSTAFTFVYRTFPASDSVANVQANAKCTFNNFWFEGGTTSCTQTGINIQGCGRVQYSNINGSNLARLITANFQLEGLAVSTNCNECTEGIYIGYLAGFDPTFFQSNNFTVDKFRMRGRQRSGGVSQTTFGIKLVGVSKCIVKESTFEGYSFKWAVDFDDENLTTVWNFDAYSNWFEPTQGLDSGAFKVRMRQGILNINEPYCQSTNYLLDFRTTTGNNKIILQNIAKWETGGGACIRNGSGNGVYAGYSFINNNQSYFINPTNITNLFFNNTPTQVAIGSVCGSDCFTFQ